MINFKETSEDEYLIMSALRGPDFEEGNLLKILTTGVLRYFVLREFKLYIVVTNPEGAKTFWRDLTQEEKSDVARLWYKHMHFSSHFMRAVEAYERLATFEKTFKSSHAKELMDYAAWLSGELYNNFLEEG